MIFDPIAASVAIIRARASGAASANKTAKAARSSHNVASATPSTARKKQTPAIPALPRVFERKPVISGRQAYLASIGASFLSQAARALGTEIRFGLDARHWIDRNPHLAEMLPAIMDLAAGLEASFRLTEGARVIPPAVDDVQPGARRISTGDAIAVPETFHDT